MRWGGTGSPIQVRGVQMDGCRQSTIKSLAWGGLSSRSLLAADLDQGGVLGRSRGRDEGNLGEFPRLNAPLLSILLLTRIAQNGKRPEMRWRIG